LESLSSIFSQFVYQVKIGYIGHSVDVVSVLSGISDKTKEKKKFEDHDN
jgi:hypothetical protein